MSSGVSSAGVVTTLKTVPGLESDEAHGTSQLTTLTTYKRGIPQSLRLD